MSTWVRVDDVQAIASVGTYWQRVSVTLRHGAVVESEAQYRAEYIDEAVARLAAMCSMAGTGFVSLDALPHAVDPATHRPVVTDDDVFDGDSEA